MQGELSVLQVLSGQYIPAIKKIQLYSADDWEVFVEEWLSLKKSEYIEIEHIGGAGDQGRDVVGYITKNKGEQYVWDNYQCKHYDHPLMPSDVWSEFAKVCYYTYKKEFPVPRNYYFVAPQGIGTSLSKLITNPEQLKIDLKKSWDTYCKNKITNNEIPLEGKLLTYIDHFDFSIFEKISPLTLIQEHENTRYHIARFGGGLPPRPSITPAPNKIGIHELPYINQLLRAYSSECGEIFKEVESLTKGTKYSNHLTRSREHFHQAELLRNFSRDTLPPGTFKKFKKELFDGTINISEEEHENGFICVKAVEKEARGLSIYSNPLSICSNGNDRVGTCHHLANDGTLTWIEEDHE